MSVRHAAVLIAIKNKYTTVFLEAFLHTDQFSSLKNMTVEYAFDFPPIMFLFRTKGRTRMEIELAGKRKDAWVDVIIQ